MDVAPGGAKVEFVQRPRVGDRLWLTLDGLEPLSAQVRWADGFVGGVQFDKPLHDAVLELLLAR